MKYSNTFYYPRQPSVLNPESFDPKIALDVL